MKFRRLVLGSVLSVALLALLAQPVAAQSVTADLIYELNNKLLLIALPITLVVQVVLIYAVIRFKDNENPKPTKENRRLEITWTVATAVILLFVGVASYGVMADQSVTFTGGEDEVAPEENDVLVQAEAYQWGWDMRYNASDNGYLDEDLEYGGSGAGPTVVVPADQDLYFQIDATDVIHGFHVPELGLKMDAIPDQTTYIKTNVSETGTYQGYCSEYCGLAHSNMYFTIEVVDQDEFDDWVEEEEQAAVEDNGEDEADEADDEAEADEADDEAEADEADDEAEADA